MINDIKQNTEIRMQQCVKLLAEYMKTIHVSRISPNILNNLKIKLYGTNFIPIQHLSSIAVKDTRTLAVTVFDSTIIKKIEKTIITSGLNFNLSLNGNTIYIYLPELTEERRIQLIKLIRIETEKTKISLRNIRRSAKNQIKILTKNKNVTEEEKRYFDNLIQTYTDTWNKTINELLEKKEMELKNF